MPAEKYRAQFEEFDLRNPHIYRALRRICLEARRKGVQRMGIRTPWEQLRWKDLTRTRRGKLDWKLNDHYTAFYARKLMALEPELKGMFEVRETPRATPAQPEQGERPPRRRIEPAPHRPRVRRPTPAPTRPVKVAQPGQLF